MRDRRRGRADAALPQRRVCGRHARPAVARRPARYAPELAATAHALRRKLDRLEANLRELWSVFLADGDYLRWNAAIGGRLKEIPTK